MIATHDVNPTLNTGVEISLIARGSIGSMRGRRARCTFLSKIISPELCESRFPPPCLLLGQDEQMDLIGPDVSVYTRVYFP